MGGLIGSALVHPAFYVLLAYHWLSGNLLAPSETTAGTVMWAIAFINLAFGYAVSILVGVISVWRRRRADLAVHALLMPLYWLLISFAAYRALYQLARDPYLWEKTEHGVGSEPRHCVAFSRLALCTRSKADARRDNAKTQHKSHFR